MSLYIISHQKENSMYRLEVLIADMEKYVKSGNDVTNSAAIPSYLRH